uniref:Lipoprotein n=1 Tax=Parastrongyloides trichosuri TaxID=131310 RepID=A0A0N4Z3E1_PARTI
MNTKFLIFFLLTVLSTTAFSTCYYNSHSVYVDPIGTEENRKYNYGGKIYNTIDEVRKAVQNANTGYQISKEELTIDSTSYQPKLKFDLVKS